MSTEPHAPSFMVQVLAHGGRSWFRYLPESKTWEYLGIHARGTEPVEYTEYRAGRSEPKDES